jgi:putative methyltransferase (TIGR04325 family)
MKTKSALNRLKQWGPVQAVRRRRYRSFFESAAGFGAHWGVFPSFAEARLAAPDSAGFNQERFASKYDDRLQRIFPYDYPVLLHLQKAFATDNACGVLDIGGHVGVHYYAYRGRIPFPSNLTWQVVEVEAVAAAGRDRCRRLGIKNLEFTTSLGDFGTIPRDVVLSAGALHYLEGPLLWDLIAGGQSKPKHIILNKLPLYDCDDFVSLQHIETGFAAHHVWNRSKFIARFVDLGYTLVDEWSVPERQLTMFDDGRSFGPYSGLYLCAEQH